MVETPAVFCLIGAVPRTEWLPPEIERDEQGFVKTGRDVAASPHWTAHDRQPRSQETSRPGVFAAGDVRSGSVKRVAAAVGEGGWPSSASMTCWERIVEESASNFFGALPVGRRRQTSCVSLCC